MAVRPASDDLDALTRGWRVCHTSFPARQLVQDDAAGAPPAAAIGDEDGVLWLAVAQPEERGVATALAAAAQRPVRLVAAAPEEIALALARSRGDAATESLRLARLGRLMDDLGLGYLMGEQRQAPPARLAAPGDHAGNGSPGKDVARLASSLPNGWGPEILGLLEGLPHLSAAVAQLRPPLRLLLPPALRDRPNGQNGGGKPLLMPWCLEGDTLLVACSDEAPAEWLSAIEAWTGLRVRYALCDAALLRAAMADRGRPLRARGGEQARSVRSGSTSWDAGLDAEVRGQVLTLARQQDVSGEVAVRHLLGQRQVAGATALPEPTPEALALLPPHLARSLAVLPLQLTSQYLEVALATECPDEEIAPALAIITGQPVRLRRVPSEALHEAQLRAYYEQGGRLKDMILRPVAELTALVAAARLHGDERAVYEALGALHGLPSIRLEAYATAPETAGLAPLERLRELRAVPLRRDGQVLWVALAEPDDRVMDELMSLTGLTIRPLLASATAIAERLASLEAMATAGQAQAPDDGSSLRRHPVIAALRAQGTLTWTALLRLLADPARSLDEALDDTGVLRHQQFASLAARLSGLELVDLRLHPREEELIDALGTRTVQVVWEDPVDPSVASLLAPATVTALGVLPVRRVGQELLVALADPFATAQEDVLRELFAQHPDLRPRLGVAPRPSMRTALARARGQVLLGERLLAQGIISDEELERALQVQRGTGVRLGQVLLSQNLVTQEQLAYFLAKQLDLEYLRLEELQPDPVVAGLLPEEVQRHLCAVPLREADGVLVVVTCDPLNRTIQDEVTARTGREARLAVCTESDLEALLERLHRGDYLQQSTSSLLEHLPDESASRVLTRVQMAGLVLALVLVVALLWRVPAWAGIALTAICSLFYLVFSAYRLYLIYQALSHSLEVRVSDEELAALEATSLPVYTILVPLYREAAVLPTLLLGLSRLDYPTTKLDVKLLLEEDDQETLSAVAATRLPFYVHPVVVPLALPRGKPKACNYGLIHARGDYVVIFDAEDVPDPDQLKKVVVAFRKADPAVACLQAKLNYYNSRQNLLTRWFTIEYSTWFDLFLPGLDAARLPVPLGGTSNHFSTARLREAGAWDPFNVTEDADLGVRLFRHGWRTAVIDSVTYEEANSRPLNWVRQRSRWVKGYIQTYLVHMRHPLQLWRTLGSRAFFSFNMVVGGTFFSLLLNPIFWLLTVLWYLTHAGFISAIFPAAIFYIGTISLFLGNVAFIYINVAGCLRRGNYDMVREALLSPVYWALMSVAAWRGFLQLWTSPFHWEKTVHGLWRRR